jgi:hypothetical protein
MIINKYINIRNHNYAVGRVAGGLPEGWAIKRADAK